MLDDIRKYYDLIKETELRPLYEDDFQFEIIKNRQELENHIYDLDDDEKIRIRNAVENYLRDSESIVFWKLS